MTERPSFDDPKPRPERRKMQTIWLRPSLKEEIEKRRGKLSRSEWIERAILAAIWRENLVHPDD